MATGGVKSGDILKQAIVINPVSKTAARLRDMTTIRAYHAQLFLNGEIFVFGGMKSLGFWTRKPEGSTSCECYSPNTCEWRNIAELIEERDLVSATLWSEFVYIAGGGSVRIERYNPKSDEMAILPYVLPGHSHLRLLLLPYEGHLLVLKGSRLYQVRVEEKSQDVFELQQYEHEVLDKDCPPSVRLFSTFFIQTDTACLMLNADTYQIQEAFKFPNI